MTLGVPSRIVSVCVMSAGMVHVCSAEEQKADELAPSAVIGRIIDLTKEELELVRGIKDAASAKAAAARIAELEKQCMELDASLEGVTEDLPEKEEQAFLAKTERLYALMESVSKELGRLHKENFYGAEELKASLGLHEDAGGTDMPPPQPLTASQEKAELARMAALAEPDKALLAALQEVRDESSYKRMLPALEKAAAGYEKLLPPGEIENRYFEDMESAAFRQVFDPVQALLEKIDAEYMRIAKLDEALAMKLADLKVNMLFSKTHDIWLDGDTAPEPVDGGIEDAEDGPSLPASRAEVGKATPAS